MKNELSADKIISQINSLTRALISSSLCEDYNFPNTIKKSNGIVEVNIKSGNNAIGLKKIPYSELYKELCLERKYNIRMIDGALISINYLFKNSKILKHRLTFFSSAQFRGVSK